MQESIISSAMQKIGILALQGCVGPHEKHLRVLGVEPVLVKSADTLLNSNLSGLILPGGESGVMLRLIDRFSMKSALETFAQTFPVWGVCAGAILMADKVFNPEQSSFSFIDVDIERNFYGRQLESFSVPLAGNSEVAFIRAPRVLRVGSSVEVLATYQEDPVWVREGNKMLSTFHPELGEAPSTLHRYFVELCKNITNQ